MTFDPACDMETNCDRLRFFNEKEHYDNESEILFLFTGRFSSGWTRGKIDAPKMVDGVMTWECEADHFAYRFYSDGSSTSWGYKFTCTPNFAVREHATMQPPDYASTPCHCVTTQLLLMQTVASFYSACSSSVIGLAFCPTWLHATVCLLAVL